MNVRWVAVVVLAGCWTGSAGPVGPATGGDLDLVMPDSTYVGAIDIAGGLRAPIVAPYRAAIERELQAVTAPLPPACRLDMLGSVRGVVIGAHDEGAAGSLVAHGLPTDRLRTCLVSSGGAPVAVVREGVYRIAVAGTDVEIRLVDRDTTWVRWAPHGSLVEPTSSRADPYELRRLLARVDRSATAWAVMKPTAADLRDSWLDKDVPPPIALAAWLRLGDGVAFDVAYRTASATTARETADYMRTQLQLASAMLQLDVSMHSDGDEVTFHGAASAATLQRLMQLVGTLESFGNLGSDAGSDGSSGD
ncbi:MAG TPA: hypothetical protein VGL61_32835 [Kofleriaceae bacterium]